MSEAFWTSLPGTIGAIGALYLAVRNSQKIEHQGGQVVELKKQVDGQGQALLDATSKLATANANIASDDKARAVATEVARAVDLAKADKDSAP